MLSCVCLNYVPLPCGAVGLSVVYCCGMPWSSADSENSVRGPINAYFNHQCISQRAVQTPLEKQLGPIASRGGQYQNSNETYGHF